MPNTKLDRSSLRLAGHLRRPPPRPTLRDISQFSARRRIPDRSKSADQVQPPEQPSIAPPPRRRGFTRLLRQPGLGLRAVGCHQARPPCARRNIRLGRRPGYRLALRPAREHDHDPDDSARLDIPHSPTTHYPAERSLTDVDPSRMGISADGFVATPDGVSALAAMPSFQPGVSRGYPEPRRGRHGP